MKRVKRIKCFFKLLGSRNWHEDIDKPTFYERVYKRRIGFDTAYKVAKILWQ